MTRPSTTARVVLLLAARCIPGHSTPSAGLGRAAKGEMAVAWAVWQRCRRHRSHSARRVGGGGHERSWWRVGGGLFGGRRRGWSPSTATGAGGAGGGAARRSGRPAAGRGMGGGRGAPFEGADGRPEPSQGTTGGHGEEARSGAWFQGHEPWQAEDLLAPSGHRLRLCPGRQARSRGGRGPGRIRAPLSDSAECKGRDRGGGRGPCPERLARARSAAQGRPPRRSLGRASKPLTLADEKPRSGPAAGGHERFARGRSGRGGRG